MGTREEQSAAVLAAEANTKQKPNTCNASPFRHPGESRDPVAFHDLRRNENDSRSKPQKQALQCRTQIALTRLRRDLSRKRER